MTISIAEHLIEMGRQLDDYDVPDEGRKVQISRSQYDELKETLEVKYGKNFTVNPYFAGFTIEVVN